MQELTVRAARDIEAFIDSHPSDRKTKLLTLVALGGIFVDAYDFASLGVGVVQLKSTFHLSPFNVGLVTAMMAMGACLGGVIGGRFVDKLGRFKILILNVALLVVAALGAAFSVNFAMLLCFRFLMGIGVGLDFPVALSYVAELVNTKSKSGSVGAWQVMWYVAAVSSGLVILPFSQGGFGNDLWRVAIGFGACPALAILLLRYFFIDESPKWSIRNLPLEQASKVIARTYNIKVNLIPEAVVTQHGTSPKITALFERKYLVRTLLASAICATQAMEYFSVGFNIPTISQAIFGHTMMNAILGAVFFNLFGILGASVGAYFSGKVGVRKLAMIGYCIVAISLLIFGTYYHQLMTSLLAALLACVLFGHSFGPGQGMTIATLSYPTEMRGLGSGWGQSMARGASIIGFFIFPLVIAATGMATTLSLIAIVPLIGLCACLLVKWDPLGQAIS